MSDPAAREIEQRIERLTSKPKEVSAPLYRLARPLLRAFGYRPELRTDKLGALLDALRAFGTKDARKKHEIEELDVAARAELEANVTALERTLVVYGRVPLAHAAWIRRLFEVFVWASRAVSEREGDTCQRIAAAMDPSRIAPPLAISREAMTSKAKAADNAKEAAQAEDFLDKPLSPEEERIVEVELLAIDHLLDSARNETEFLGRRRKLLEAARKLLFDAAAAMPLGKEGVEVRRRYLAKEIARIDRLEAAGLSAQKGLTYQAKEALARGERQRLHAALVALDGVALAAGDEALVEKTARGRLKMGDGEEGDPEAEKQRDLRRSSEAMFGHEAMSAIAEGYVEARKSQKKAPKEETPEEKKYRLLALEWLSPEHESETHAALCSMDGTVDVGVPLAPERVTEVETRVRLVRYPTPHLLLMPARDVADVPHAIIEDPRLVLFSLAEGRLLARRFVAEEHKKRERIKMVGEARVYVLDGSSSMLEDGKKGARARVRDAILLAELGMLVRRFSESQRQTRIVMHYRYFTKKVHPISRIDSAKTALTAMADVAGRVWRGGTDIENALLSSFEQIRKAKEEDPDLARAQIVLVTDGNAEVREDVIQKAREEMGELPIAVSVIALGEENPALRAIVARQRAQGERAFYHFLDDDALVEICEGKLFSGPSLYAPIEANEKNLSVEVRAARLRAELGALVEELSAEGERKRAQALQDAIEHADEQVAFAGAEAELGLHAQKEGASEGQKALREAIERDRRKLDARFLRWFPDPESLAETQAAAEEGEEPRAEPLGRSSDAEAVVVVLSTIAEVISDFGGTDLSKKAEAIELLDRLLPDAMLSPARYAAVFRDEPTIVKEALRALHRAANPLRQS